MKKHKSFCILCSILLIAGCSKDDSPTPVELTVLELLTSGKWYVESITNNPLSDCQKHTNLEFFINGNVVTNNYSLDDDGVCTSVDVSSRTYELLSDTQLLIVYPDGGEDDIEILNISETELILRQEMGGEFYTMIFDKNPGNG